MRNTIEFVLNGEPRRLEAVDPAITVLRYLRESERLVGTKEGCAEGDCGACTAVVTELDGGGLSYRAVNTCIQFLATLDGKGLITVEHLRGSNGDLHPVQQAMVDAHASQCGFCTPGFVMSLFAGVQNAVPTKRQDVDDLLAGNLCRCTGYTPIINAAAKALELPGENVFKSRETHIAGLLRKLPASESVRLESEGRCFIAPATAQELSEVLIKHPQATLLAGGTDVGLFVTKKHVQPEVLVYIGKIKALNEISAGDEGIRIGAGVTLERAWPALVALYPGMNELVRRFGAVQVRNVGTIGGNIANGSPIGDMPPALVAAGATLRLRRGGKTRDLPLEDFFLAYGKQDRLPSEFVEFVLVPRPAPNSILKVYKISKRLDQDISAVCGAFNLTFEPRTSGPAVKDARVCFGGMAGTPQRAARCEEFLRNKPWNEATVSAAQDVLRGCYEPLSDWRATARYRNQVAGNLLKKYFLETTTRRAINLAGRGERVPYEA